MLLIISNPDDFSTNEVLDWLIAAGKPFTRLHRLIKIQSVTAAGQGFRINDSLDIDPDTISAIWYRRGGHWSAAGQPEGEGELTSELRLFQQRELAALQQLFYHNLRRVPVRLGDYYYTNVNKMVVLECAAAAGLLVPPWLITTEKAELLAWFRLRQGRVINKGIDWSLGFVRNEFSLPGYTIALTENMIDSLPDRFFPSLFQQNISKRYELRIFVLDGVFYPMAIFSQQDAQTQTDFRRYNYEKPNRSVPFRLPAATEAQLRRLMAELKLESGSVDMMVEEESGDFYFLEVNPLGQFGMTSHPCNYYLEKAIAEYLISQPIV